MASEQAQSIVGNASQFLERLDGIGATMEDEDGQQDSATEVGSDKASDVDGPMGNVSVSTTSPIDPNLRSSIDLEPVALKHETADLSTVDESLSQSFVAEQNVPVITPTPKKNTKSTLSAKPPLSRTPEPAVHQSSDSLEALETASKPMDVKKYQSKIRKLEKEKNELEQQTCDLQLSVASLSKELQFALTEKLSHDAQHSEERQDFLDQIAALKEDQEKAENQFATQLAAVKEQYQHELTRVCAEYETKIGDLKAKFQAQEEELLVLQLKKDHQVCYY
ncbi:hypothetical protein EON65_24075 [archaeon]|nr:MAG: hypothetical protein EON65_24075 [archaeon]